MDVLQGAWGTLAGMGHAVAARLPLVAVAVVVFYAFYFGGKGVRALVLHTAARTRRHHSVGRVLGRLAMGVMALVGALVGAVIVFPAFKFGDLIGLLGLGSVAVGFAFRDVAQNYLAGLLLLLTEPFRIGDQIAVSGYEGTVEDIETRATTVKTYDGRRVVIPNARLFTESVIVNTAFDKRRAQYDVGIGVGDDIAEAKRVILGAVRGCEGVLAEPPPEVLVVDLADSSVKLRVWWWTDPPTRNNELHVLDRCLTAIKESLIAHGIDLPFPTTQVLLHDQTEEGDGDRSRQREGWPAGRGAVPEPRSIAGALRHAAEVGRATRSGEPQGGRAQGDGAGDREGSPP